MGGANSHPLSWVGRVKVLVPSHTSLDLKNSSIVGYFKKINAFLVYSILCFHKTVHNKWCLDKKVHEKIENGLERGFSELSETTSLNN